MGRMLDWQQMLPPHADTGLRRRRTDCADGAGDFAERSPQDRFDSLVRLVRYFERHADEWVVVTGQEVQVDLRRAMALAELAQARRPH